jgi:Holliday junction resolvasome RuvABC endonuclease subunit
MAFGIMGLDLSLVATGLALTDPRDGNSIETRTLTSRNRGVERLAGYVDEIMAAAMGYRLTLAVIEDLPIGARNNAAGPLGMLHGAVRVALWREGYEIVLAAPASLKKYATGKGNATKSDMRMALYQRAGLDVRDDDQVDAWWLAAMGRDRYGAPVVTLPQTHTVALAKVEWPDLSEVTG